MEIFVFAECIDVFHSVYVRTFSVFFYGIVDVITAEIAFSLIFHYVFVCQNRFSLIYL